MTAVVTASASNPNRIDLPGDYFFDRLTDNTDNWFLFRSSTSSVLARWIGDEPRQFAAAINAESARADAAEARVRELEVAGSGLLVEWDMLMRYGKAANERVRFARAALIESEK